jgi:Leucine Rich repeat
MSEQVGVVLVFLGLFLVASGSLVLLVRGLRVLLGRVERRRLVGPALLVGAGLVVGAAPFVAQSAWMALVGLGERERVVDGRRALVLTGWDRPDYAILTRKRDVEILEIGNADVDDTTLDLLLGMDRLRELSLNDTKITDAGLAKLKQLPTLESLRIARTGVTADGVRGFLEDPPPLLRQIDVSGNGIPTSILRRWKNAGATEGDPGRDGGAVALERRYVN